MKPYGEAYPVGTSVRIRDRDSLEQFQRDWQYHHKLTEEQVMFAGSVASIVEVAFYHGGGALYQLSGIPGTWHEECLSRE